MTERAEKLREALEQHVRAEQTAAAICDTLGITREMVARLLLGASRDVCEARDFGAGGDDIGGDCQDAADALAALLEAACWCLDNPHQEHLP